MSGQVEILATSAVTPDDLADLASEVRNWGVEPLVRRMPARRGAAELSWLVLLTIPAEVIAKTMLERFAADAYTGLRRLVERLVRGARRHNGVGSEPPDKVLVESGNTGAQFTLEADLPIEAYHQMFAEIAGRAADEGVRVFDRESLRWVLPAPA